MHVLHLISGGDTGGAKTHIMTLLPELSKSIDITLGVFLEDSFLREANYHQIKTKLFKQKSRFDLSVISDIVDYCKENKVDIIHTHGARANFVASFLMKKLDVKFITTVHSDYNLDFKGIFYKQLIYKNLNLYALKKFSNFIAVSDSFKKMLLDRNFKDRDISVVYNGINLKKEEDFIEKNDFLNRYNIPTDGYYFGILARLDEVKDHKTFLKAAKEFLKNNRAYFLIGGSGHLENDLKKMAHDFGIEKNVFFLGEVKDPFSFLNAIDVNVLTSLSESFPYTILEGGKFKKPIISTEVGGINKLVVSGKNGFLFNVENYLELSELFKKCVEDKENTKIIGKNLYRDIINHYSAESMSAQHENIYKRILYGKKLVMSGFYGFDNQGDDAILESIITEFKRQDPNINITVLSNNPKKTSMIYGVKSVYRFNPIKLYKILKKSDMLVSGGGSLLQDITSSRSLWYYILVINLAKKLGKKVIVYANGIGPINKKLNRKLTTKVLDKVDLITLRDEDSVKYTNDLGIDSTKLLLRSDPVFLLKPNMEEAKNVIANMGITDDFMIINLRPWRSENNYIEILKRVIKELVKQSKKILLLPMHTKQDLPLLKEIYNSFEKNVFLLEQEIPVTTLLGIMKLSKLVIAMRLHGLIYASSVLTKNIALSYDPKVIGFMKEIDSNYIIDINKLSYKDLYEMILSIEKDDEILAKIELNEIKRKELAVLNAKEALNMVKNNE